MKSLHSSKLWADKMCRKHMFARKLFYNQNGQQDRNNVFFFFSLGVNLFPLKRKNKLKIGIQHWLIYSSMSESETAYVALGNRRLFELMFRLCWKSQPRHQKAFAIREHFGRQTFGVIQGTVCLEAISRKRRNVDFGCRRTARVGLLEVR